VNLMLSREALLAPAPLGALVWSHDRSFSGHVLDPDQPQRKFTVELLVDGFVVACARADAPCPDIAVGDGCYGFSIALAPELLAGAAVVEARLANLGTPVGAPLRLLVPEAGAGAGPEVGTLRWLGGLRFSGQVGEGDGPVEIAVDGEPVARIMPDGWCHAGDASDARPMRAFDLHLPPRFADGAAHRLVARDARGRELRESPHPFVAFADGLSGAADGLRDPLRAELFDRLVPAAVPFADFARWRAALPDPAPAATSACLVAVVVIGPGDAEATAASLDAQSHGPWVAAAMGGSAAARFAPALLQDFLAGDGAGADIVVAVPAGAELMPDALARLAAAFAAAPDARAAYGDLALAGADGSQWPLALPGFDAERLLEQGYAAHVFALRRDVAEAALAAGADTLYRLFNAQLDHDAAAGRHILHLPLPLATLPAMDMAAAAEALREATAQHLAARGVAAEVSVGQGRCLPAVRVRRAPPPGGVSVLVPTRNRLDLLRPCIESIRPALAKVGGEIIVIDNDSSDAETLAYLAELEVSGARVLRVPGPFNYARLNNLAAAEAQGAFLCLLNNDVIAGDDGWLAEMLGRLADPEVAAVGALLVWPSGIIQHGGVVLGPNFAATHAGNDRLADDPGYGDMFRVARDCGAVTGACLLTRRDDFLASGGLDAERFAVAFNDVDYCLRLRAAGRRVVFTPHARLLHQESASRGRDQAPDRKARLARELRQLRALWGEALLDDPYYSPVLSLDAVPFSALASPARNMAPRRTLPPRRIDVPAGF
jgi:GT2 family glycosyltransferase